MKAKRVCSIDSQYTLFLFLLVNRCEINDVFFIFWKNIPNYILTKFKNSIQNYYDFNIIGNDDFRNNFHYFLRFYKTLLKYNLFMASPCGQDHLPFSRLYLNFFWRKFTEYEDGLESYKDHSSLNVDKSIKNIIKLKDSQPWFGMSNKTYKIYLTNPQRSIPDYLRRKVCWVNVLDLWNSLSKDKQDYIKDLFHLKDILLAESVDTLLLTGPFSEDNLCSEEEKIHAVNLIINQYPKENIAIKCHYRENTEYDRYFKNVMIIREKFPLELFLLSYQTKIKRIISLDNCSVVNFLDQYFPNLEYINAKFLYNRTCKP